MAYAQFSTAGATFTDGTALPLTLTVDGTNSLIVPAADSITLTDGIYLIHYETEGTLSEATQGFTVSPSLNGTALTPYVSEFNGSTDYLTGEAQSTFLVEAPASAVLAFDFSTTDTDGVSDGTVNVTVIKLNS